MISLGTDATIAQHIETIIQRSYVIERMEGATKYLVPSTLGIGLIEGYNRIGLAKNVSKPQLRREVSAGWSSYSGIFFMDPCRRNAEWFKFAKGPRRSTICWSEVWTNTRRCLSSSVESSNE